MKILYIHQYFRTPEEGGAVRSYYLGRALVEKGFQVEMITARNATKYKVEDVQGIKVHYLPVAYKNEFSFWRRIFSFVRFYQKAFWLSRKISGVSLVYATSTPLTVGLLALKIKRKLMIPYIFEARDLWPDAPIAMGAIRNRWLKKVLFRMEKAIYRQAEELVALSPPVKTIIESRSAGKRVRLIPNMADTAFFRHAAPDPELHDRLNAGKNFIVCYFGSIGKVNQLESLIGLASKAFEKQMPFTFLIIGEGAALPGIRKQARKKNLNNVVFLPLVSKSELRRYLSVSDAVYVSFAEPKALEFSSPNKFFDALAAGKYIIYNKSGWIREEIEEYGCGVFADPADPEQTIERLKTLSADPEELKRCQARAAALAEKYSRKKLTAEFVEMISSYASRPANPAGILTP